MDTGGTTVRTSDDGDYAPQEAIEKFVDELIWGLDGERVRFEDEAHGHIVHGGTRWSVWSLGGQRTDCP